MSAIFEINLIYKKHILVEEVLNLIKNNCISYSISNINIMDNWQYEKFFSYEKYPFNELDLLILENKIISIEGILDLVHRFGVNFYKINNEMYSIEFWISTKKLEKLDSNYINKDNINIYIEIIRIIIKILSRESLIVCMIGSELLIKKMDSLKEILLNSKNVSIYFLNSNINLKIKDYNKISLEGFNLYYLYKDN